jgi:SAM-dependent methyltransferase
VPLDSLGIVACPICDASGSLLPVRVPRGDIHIRKYRELYGQADRSPWKVCGNCGFVHQNPRPSLDALENFYARGCYHSPDIPDNVERYLRFSRWYYQEKIEYALASSRLQGARVLEIGCGLGGALKLFSEKGWTTAGIEPDGRQAAFASRQLGVEGVIEGTVDDFFSLSERVDLVFSNHAFEHLADLKSVVRAVVRVLKPGGFVFTAVPTYYLNRSTLSKQWMNSAHYSLFTHHSLNQLFAYYGLEEVSHTYRGWHKEIDDLWHVACLTDVRREPSRFFENPRTVSRYLAIYNPIRSFVFSPVYAAHARRVAALTAMGNVYRMLRRDPSSLVRKLVDRRQG